MHFPSPDFAAFHATGAGPFVCHGPLGSSQVPSLGVSAEASG